MKRIVLAITGASGVLYGIKLLEALHELNDIQTHLILSEAAAWNISYETDYSVDAVCSLADYVYDNSHIWEKPASGSYSIDAMVINPCSMKTLAAIRCGLADNLITRAADATIKEQRKLIICPRETPLSAIHLDNMAYLAHLGVCILPPMPAFYHKPQTIEHLLQHHCMKVFDQLGLPFDDVGRWGEHHD